jgi:molybdopterin/thiamine biosynthesis adenylyltransferase
MVTEETILCRRRRRAVLVGCGAIGSHAAPLLARLPDLAELVLIDPDTYDESNLQGQAILPSEVGMPKVTALARRIRRQAPGLKVETAQQPVELVPRGWFRNAVVISAVDSRRARAAINEIGWPLGETIIDAGVDGANWLARCNVYRPGDGHACLECAWNDADYRARDSVVSCQGSLDVGATNAPASLSSIAAGLLVAACHQLSTGQLDSAPSCYQVLYDYRHHRCHHTKYTPNPDCRFDHQIWDVRTQAMSLKDTSLGAFLSSMAPASHGNLQLPGNHFARRLVCRCGAMRDRVLVLERALTPARTRCSSCGGQLAVSAFHAQSHVPLPVDARHARRSLWSIGLRPGDIVALGDATTMRHIELVNLPAGTGKALIATSSPGGSDDHD